MYLYCQLTSPSGDTKYSLYSSRISLLSLDMLDPSGLSENSKLSGGGILSPTARNYYSSTSSAKVPCGAYTCLEFRSKRKLCNTQSADTSFVTISGHSYIGFLNVLNLCRSKPNAFSTTRRAIDSL